MEVQAKQTDTECLDPEMDEELADVLTAICVVSKRLARNLTMLSRQDREKTGVSKPVEKPITLEAIRSVLAEKAAPSYLQGS